MPTLDVEGTRLNYADEGEGPPVVLLHGGTSNNRQWRGLTARLSDRFRVLAPDFNGHGGTSPWRHHRPLAFADEWRLVEAMLDLAGEGVHLVGHSYGGWVAVDGALDAQERLRSLTLIEPSAFHILVNDSESEALAEARRLCQMHVDLVGEGRLEELAERFMDYWMAPGSWAAVPEERKEKVLTLLPLHTQGWVAGLALDIPLDAYARLDVPTLLVRGTTTVLPSRRVVDLLLATLPDCRLVEIEGAGHMSPMTHAGEVDAAIGAHLERHAGR